MSSKSEYFKSMRIHMPTPDNEPYPLRFYHGTALSDINVVIQETLDNLKKGSKNTRLRAWNRPDGIEILDSTKSLYRLDSIVLSEYQPKIHNKSFITSAPVSPTGSQNPTEDISTGLFQTKELETKSTRHFKPGSVQNSYKGPIVEKVPRYMRAQSFSQNAQSIKNRPRSAVRSFLAAKPVVQQVNKAPNTEGNLLARVESSRLIVVSQERVDTSMTFNPLKTPGLADQQNNYSFSFGHRREPPSSRAQVLMNESASVYEDTKNEETLNPHRSARGTRRNFSQGPNASAEVLTLSIKKVPNVTTQLYTGHVATVPIDGNDQDIYSFIKGYSPFSYFAEATENVYNQKLPPPVYLTYQQLLDKRAPEKNDILRGLEVTPAGELKLVDEQIIKNQKGILREVLQSLVKSIAEGRGIIGVSLPVRIFEPRSLLERICDWWTYIPNFIVPAAVLSDPVERMKKVIAAAIGGLYVSAKQLKPFNPLLGETFQAVFPTRKISINIEHTSHHPPIANFLLSHKDFKFWGRYEFFAKIEGVTKNILLMHQQGPNHVDFKDGQRITFHWPHLYVEGITHGDRVCKYTGYMKFIDEKNQIKAIIKLGESGDQQNLPKKRSDVFYGKIYRYKKSDSSLSKKKTFKSEEEFGDLEEELHTLYGSWLEYLRVDEKEIWNIDKDVPSHYIPIEHPLPSDSRFREDLIWMKKNNKKHAQEWKLKLEERQRYERKVRMDNAKKQKK